jgi:hypothetical protein
MDNEEKKLTPYEADMLETVRARLCEDDDRNEDDRRLNPLDVALAFAKQQAKNGNSGPLHKLLNGVLSKHFVRGDIFGPRGFTAVPYRPKILVNGKLVVLRVRRRSASNPFVEMAQSQEEQADIIRRIRQILKEETGTKRVNAALLHKIAANVLNCEPGDISKIVHRNL